MYWNTTVSFLVLISSLATNSVYFIICLTILSSLQERVGGDKLDGPCDIEPGIEKMLATSEISLFTILFTVVG
jgi:hypothetical protein